MSTRQRQAKRKRLAQVCAECGATENLTVDHKLALCLGGTNADENLQMLCRPCNQTKGRAECLELDRLPGSTITASCRGRRGYKSRRAAQQAIAAKNITAFTVKCCQCQKYHIST